MEDNYPYGFVQKEVEAVEGFDNDDSIPSNTPFLAYMRAKLLSLVWKWVRGTIFLYGSTINLLPGVLVVWGAICSLHIRLQPIC